MSSVILTNWTVYYSDDAAAGAGMKQIKWTGTTGTTSVNALYTALMDLFDNSSQNNYFDSIPIKAITPTLYEIGSSDAGDRQPWFIDPDSVQHLIGAGLNSSKWTRDTTTRTASHGIYKLTRSTSNIVVGDIGRTFTTSGTATGWILHVSGTSIWARSTDGTSTHDLGAITSITSGGRTDTITARVTNESIWSNIYTLGTIRDDTELYVYQYFAALTQWWTTGHLDILVLVKDFGTTIDSGILTVYARQYSKTYDHFVVTVPTGGRTPVPLATNNDANNYTGYRTFTAQSGTGTNTFTVANYIYVGTNWSTATAKGVLTAVGGTSGASSTPILTYYLIGNLTDFSNGNAIKEYDPVTGANGDATCTAAAPTNTGPLASPSSTLTVRFGGSLHDLNNGYGNAPYSVTLDLLDSITVSQLYERTKYLTRQGQTTDIDTETSQSIIGQAYAAIGDYYLPYDTGSVDNPFTEGETITATGSFSCILTSKHDQGSSEGFLIVRNVRGTIPVDNTTLTGTTSTHTALIDTNVGADPVAAISPVKVSPFGTYAGGKFFGARGVWLANVPAADANNYELIDSEGNRQVPPTSIALTMTGIQNGDQVAIFESTGSGSYEVNKSQFHFQTSYSAGVTSIRVTDNIPNDTPATGYIHLVKRDAAGDITGEERLAYSAWVNDNRPTYSTFTIAATSLTYDTNCTAFVGYLDQTAAGTSASKSLIYTATRYLVATVRKAGILPYTTIGTLSNSNLIINMTRLTDPNYTTDPASGFTLNYTRKTITHTSGSTIYTVNQLYDYCQEQLAAALQMDDAVPMSAQTPSAFTLVNGWFIDPASLQYIKSGSLQTSGWLHPTAIDGVHILTFGSTYGGPPVSGDIGKPVVGVTTGDTGRLLYFDNTLKKWWVRSDAADDLFDIAENITLTGGTSGTRTTAAASVSGENIWTNIYTLGTIAANTQIYVYQNGARITPWWSTGHIDILILIKEAGTEIDSGNVTVLARQYSKLYDHYTADLSSGNQTPIPLATFNDTNNPSGYRTFTGSSGTGSFVAGDIIQKVGDATRIAIITAVGGTATDPIITYYLYQYPFTDFSAADAITNNTRAGTCTAAAPTNTGPAILAGVTITFSSINRDLSNGNGLQPYNVEIDCNSQPLAQIYEYLKYVTRYGYLTTINSIPGEAYLAANASYDPTKQAPFGTFAGSKFFGARGIWLKNVRSADKNYYELIDANNVRQVPPNTINIQVSGVEVGNRVSVFRTTGDNETIDRAVYISHASANTSGLGTFTTTLAIAKDTPLTGTLRVVNNNINDEDQYAYDSWTGSTFTFSSGVTLNHTYDSSDTAYVAYIDRLATSPTESEAVTYDVDRYVLTVVRIAGKIPFKVRGQVTNIGLTATAIGTADTIYTAG